MFEFLSIEVAYSSTFLYKMCVTAGLSTWHSGLTPALWATVPAGLMGLVGLGSNAGGFSLSS